jgi:UDP-3-O-[3-hydroxymyristoyl] glucosamine N-acyltransferase
MIIANQKPIAIIGYRLSSMTHEFVNSVSKTHQSQVFEPKEYLALTNKDQYQYAVASWIDIDQRQTIIKDIDHQNLDLVTYIDDTAIVDGRVAAGTFVFPFSRIGLNAKVDRHCIISSYSLIGHYCELGVGCLVRPGVIVAGKGKVGNYCILNLRSSVCNGVTICNNTTIMGFSGVTKNITISGRYAGTPARRIGETLSQVG